MIYELTIKTCKLSKEGNLRMGKKKRKLSLLPPGSKLIEWAYLIGEYPFTSV